MELASEDIGFSDAIQRVLVCRLRFWRGECIRASCRLAQDRPSSWDVSPIMSVLLVISEVLGSPLGSFVYHLLLLLAV